MYTLRMGVGNMARMTFKAGDEYAIKLSKYAANNDAIAKKAIYQGAKVVADKIKDNLKGVLSEKATGELVDSFGISKIDTDKNGDWNAKIGFDGYDSNGIPNQLKARVLESGTSTIKKKPFVRPALNATRKSTVEVMNKVIDEETEKLFK